LKNISLYIGAFMCCTVVLLIPGIIFIAFWAISRVTEEKTVEHIHHYKNDPVDFMMYDKRWIPPEQPKKINKFEGNIIG